MSRRSLLNILAGLVALVATLHGVALVFSLYWRFWWYDLLAHFLGGAFVALLICWVLIFSGYVRSAPPSRIRLAMSMLVGTLLIGVGWEVYERLLGHTWSPEGYMLDTAIDIVMDMLGGIASVLFVSNRNTGAVPENSNRTASL